MCPLPPTYKHTLGFAGGKIGRKEEERGKRKGGGHKYGEGGEGRRTIENYFVRAR